MTQATGAPAGDDRPDAPGRGTDRSLVRRYRSGDKDAATALFVRYARRLRALAAAQSSPEFAARFDADDIVQSVFRTFFDGVHQHGYEIPEGAELWNLLLVMALNKIRNQAAFHRAAKRSVRLTVHEGALADDELPCREGHAALLKLVVDEQLEMLPPSNQRIVRLRIEGYEIGEIVAQTGRSRRTIERVLQEFRQTLADAR